MGGGGGGGGMVTPFTPCPPPPHLTFDCAQSSSCNTLLLKVFEIILMRKNTTDRDRSQVESALGKIINLAVCDNNYLFL